MVMQSKINAILGRETVDGEILETTTVSLALLTGFLIIP